MPDPRKQQRADSPDLMRQLMMGGEPTGETNTPQLPEWSTKEYLPEWEPREQAESDGYAERTFDNFTRLPRFVYNNFVQPLSSAAGAVTEVATDAISRRETPRWRVPLPPQRGQELLPPALEHLEEERAGGD